MLKFTSRSSEKVGLPPGTLIHIGAIRTDPAKITLIDYDADQVREKEIHSVEECLSYKDQPTTSWFNVDGIHDVNLIEAMGGLFGLHPLILEDIVHTNQRPKIEDFGDYLYIVLKMLRYDDATAEIEAEQISLILGKNFVISFQEHSGDVFEPVRHRIRNGKGRIRKWDSDYLTYALIDAVVDNYFIVLEKISEDLEELQDQLIGNPEPEALTVIQNMKREMIFLRKTVWPLREAVSGLQRADTDLIKASVGVYLRDVYDHTIQVIDTIETFRDLLAGLLDIYLSSVSNRMNEIMKVLTIMASIFIPLTFIAGIYGMNFEYMPELKLHWGYAAIWGVMVVSAVVMLLLFKRKKWF